MVGSVISPPNQELPNLQRYDWPVVNQFEGLEDPLQAFLDLDLTAQRQLLADIRKESEQHGRYIQGCLGEIYPYIYGYPNSPCYITTNDELEIKLQQAKILLERELIDWLNLSPIPKGLNQVEAANYLSEVVNDNTGVYHELFEFIASKASKAAVITFLHTETIRTEVVDDEVALMTVGLQRPLKEASASNLWDECGRGQLAEFHTYWLRMLLEQTNTWEQFAGCVAKIC